MSPQGTQKEVHYAAIELLQDMLEYLLQTTGLPKHLQQVHFDYALSET